MQLFQCKKKEFLHKYVTMEETWIHHFTLESNQQSAEWTVAGEIRPKGPKMQTLADKVLASIFWDAQSILFIDYYEKERTINSEYYIALLVHLKEEIVKNSHKWRRKKCSFTKTMHSITSQSQWWQNYMNYTLNCFCTYPILQIWPSVTTGCLQTSKECFRERDLVPMKNWYRKGGAYFEAKDKVFYKKGIELLEKCWNQSPSWVIQC